MLGIIIDDIVQLIYKIKLPGPALLGEGKPENQNHAIIFTRGEGLQTIDMNQVSRYSSTYDLSGIYIYFVFVALGILLANRTFIHNQTG